MVYHITDHALERFQERHCSSATRQTVIDCLRKWQYVRKGYGGAVVVKASGYFWVVKMDDEQTEMIVKTVYAKRRKRQRLPHKTLLTRHWERRFRHRENMKIWEMERIWQLCTN